MNYFSFGDRFIFKPSKKIFKVVDVFILGKHDDQCYYNIKNGNHIMKMISEKDLEYVKVDEHVDAIKKLEDRIVLLENLLLNLTKN